MRKTKQIIAIVVILAMLPVFAGCAKGEKTSVKQEQTQVKGNNEKKDDKVNTDSEAAKNDEHPYWISEKPVTLTYHEMSAAAWKEDTPVAKKLTEYTNVSLKGTISQSQTDAKQAYSLMIASGELADLVYYHDRNEIMKHANDGAFIPLQDLIAEHAPNITKYLNDYPQAKKAATALDGNIYYVPQFNDGLTARGYFIRQDWLERLGLEVPTSVDAFYNVLKAFKEQDANGNGDTSDEIPFFARNSKAVQDTLVYLFDAYHHLYVDGDKIKYGPIEPNFKTAMANLAEWYAEGLIDAEIFTRGGTSRDIMLNDNLGGVTHDWFGSTSGYNDRVPDKVEGFSFQPMLPPTTVSGNMVEPTIRSSGYGAGTAISSQCKDPVLAIKLLDFCFTQEARSLFNFGIEGEDYDMVEGKEIFRDSILKAENGALAALRERGAQLAMSFHQDFEYEKQWINPIAVKGMEMYLEKDILIPEYPILNLTDDEKKRYSELIGAINTYVDERIQRWILGVEDVESTYDTFVKELKGLGIEEVMEIQTNALNR